MPFAQVHLGGDIGNFQSAGQVIPDEANRVVDDWFANIEATSGNTSASKATLDTLRATSSRRRLGEAANDSLITWLPLGDHHRRGSG